ncbi:hypothetical protein K1719_036355 [Acacia pycnantha]|nr:hypothetical protein K1719_036355 [Acacia pycnantha]
MERLEKIGFDKLVHICCAQIPRHLCGQFMDSFDPPTKNVAIRGKSFHLRPEDVKQLMGLPCGGGEIERKARKDDKAFKSLKRSYGSVPYKMIGTWIIESTVEEQFEILFVIYALGTLLCPTASIKVSDALLKVIVATKEDFREFDWCTFVLNELIYCLQNFPLGPLQAPTVEDAIHFWDDTKIKRRVKIERESKKGLLLPYGDEVGHHLRNCSQKQPSLTRKTLQGAESDVNDEVQSEDEEPCSQNEEDGEEDEDEGSKPNGEDEGCKAKFMSMVAKTLVGDELKTSGHVRRHIFSSELMQKMAKNPQKWSLEAHEKELLPEHIGYNIGDCDFIVGPTLHLSHWFCYIFEIKTMCFYAIDSYVDNLTYEKMRECC